MCDTKMEISAGKNCIMEASFEAFQRLYREY
jgi:hypothetical protein